MTAPALNSNIWSIDCTCYGLNTSGEYVETGLKLVWDNGAMPIEAWYLSFISGQTIEYYMNTVQGSERW